MKCNICGEELAEGTALCPICGAQLAPSSQPAAVRAEAPADISSSKDRNEIFALLDEAEQTAFKLDTLYAQYRNADEGLNFNPQVPVNRTGLILFIVGWATIWVFGAGLILVVIGAILKGKENKRVEAEKSRLRNIAYDKLHKKQDEILKEIPEVYNSSSICGRFPLQYTNLDAVDKIRSYITNMRADTLKEAFNILEQEYHNQKMLNAQLRTLESQLNTEMAAKGAYNAAVAAAIANSQAAYYARKTYEAVYNS